MRLFRWRSTLFVIHLGIGPKDLSELPKHRLELKSYPHGFFPLLVLLIINTHKIKPTKNTSAYICKKLIYFSRPKIKLDPSGTILAGS